MQSEAIITVIADDRVGIIKDLSKAVHDAGANWLDSSFAQLAGKFTGVLSISIDEQQLARFEQAMANLQSVGISATVSRGVPNKQKDASLSIMVIGNDRPGIIHEIAERLRLAGASIKKLSSSTSMAPMSGGVLFKATVTLSINENTPEERVLSTLEDISNDIIIEVTE